MACGGVPTHPSLGTPEEGFDLRPERLPSRPLGSTPFDLESPRSQGCLPAAAGGLGRPAPARAPLPTSCARGPPRSDVRPPAAAGGWGSLVRYAAALSGLPQDS